MYSKNIEPQVSDKDIPCLKLLEVVEDANNQKVYLTPYINMRITPDMLSGKTLIEPGHNLDTINNINCGNYVRIKEGFIHTFDYDISIMSLKYPIEIFENFVMQGLDCSIGPDVVKQLGYPYYTFPHILNVTLCKCVIPAGTPYFKGSKHSNPYFEDQYASKAIRITKILHEFTKDDYMEEDENKIYNFIKDIIENNKL